MALTNPKVPIKILLHLMCTLNSRAMYIIVVYVMVKCLAHWHKCQYDRDSNPLTNPELGSSEQIAQPRHTIFCSLFFIPLPFIETTKQKYLYKYTILSQSLPHITEIFDICYHKQKILIWYHHRSLKTCFYQIITFLHSNSTMFQV